MWSHIVKFFRKTRIWLRKVRALALIAAGYVLSSVLPLPLLVTDIMALGTIDSKDRIPIIIEFLGVIATLLAVYVALYKDDIVAKKKYAKLSLSLSNDDPGFEEVVAGNTGNGNNGSVITADRYHAFISVTNTGTIGANRCEVELSSATIKYPGNVEAQNILIHGSRRLQWAENDSRIDIHPSRSKRMKLFEIAAQNQGNEGEAPLYCMNMGWSETGEGVLTFDGNDTQRTMYLTYNVYSDNCEIAELKLEIYWDGRWEPRLSEMKQHLKVSRSDK